ncbi:MAG: four helix bundle protein [Myxococcota bacterium]
MESQLPQKKLEVHALAIEMLVLVHRGSERLPRGQGALADQMNRAALSTTLAIAEGAGAVTARAKAARFALARGEAGEVAACAEICRVLGFLPAADADAIEHHATRIAAMLTRLIQRFSGDTFRA